MIIADYHLHSCYSGDSEALMEEYIEKAIQSGLSRICFTDHMDPDYPPLPHKSEESYHNIFLFDIADYFSKLEELKVKYRASLQISIGIELGVTPETQSFCAKIVNAAPYDFVLASTHVLDHMDPYYPEFWNKYSSEEGLQLYFQTIANTIRTFHDFDSYGHIDYITRYMKEPEKRNYCYEAFQETLDYILKELIIQGKTLELNTAGYKYGLNRPHPQPEVLKRYRELGGEQITIGSDAHTPEHLAYDFKKAEELLLSLGFRYYTVFEERKAIHYPLGKD